jgi:hypothetical protein
MTVINFKPTAEELATEAAKLPAVNTDTEPVFEVAPIGYECPCGQTYGEPCQLCNCLDIVDYKPIYA